MDHRTFFSDNNGHAKYIDPGATALEASVAAVSKYGGALAGYRTMLDALIPASKVLREASKGILLRSMFLYVYTLVHLNYLH